MKKKKDFDVKMAFCSYYFSERVITFIHVLVMETDVHYSVGLAPERETNMNSRAIIQQHLP